jgi:hypothetical protein
MRILAAALLAVPCVLGEVSVQRGENPWPEWPELRTVTEAQAVATRAEPDFSADRGAYAEPSDLAVSPEVGLAELEADPVPPRPIVTEAQFCEALTDAARTNDIPVAFFARLIWQESQFKYDEVSHAGAQGVAQFMPQTAVEVGLDDPFDPLKALSASARLLRKLRDQLGNIGLAAAAYNAGSGRIQNWLARRGPLPDETRNYVRRITGNSAESWTAEDQRVAVLRALPADASCAGVGGLSHDTGVMAVAVALAPDVRAVLEKVRLAEIAARRKAAELRRHLAHRGKGAKGTQVARAAGHKGQRGAGTRVASAER